MVSTAAGPAIHTLTLNLSRNATFWLEVAAMVVSEIIDRLSPNMAPPTTAPMAYTASICVTCEKPKAIGAQAAIVPMDVPMAVAIKAAITNSIGSTNSEGITDNPI